MSAKDQPFFDDIISRYAGQTYFACEDLDLTFTPGMVEQVTKRFNELWQTTKDIVHITELLADETKRDEDELFVLLIDLSRKFKIARSKRGMR